jgi:hypothetical protein
MNDHIPYVSVDPNPNDLPGGRVIQQVLDGLAGWALLASLGAMLIGAMVWALSSHAGNYHGASKGKTTVLVSAVAALLAGAAPALVNFFSNLGQRV